MKSANLEYKRVVVKIGASLLYRQDKLDVVFIEHIAGQLAHLMREAKDAIIVSSGAVAFGMSLLGLERRPKELASLQAAAAIGQHELMHAYSREFKARDIQCAQVLLTWDDFNSRKRYLNAKNTLNTLLKLRSLPVINENDTVSTEEIKFGDNDRLSSLVANLVSADILIILSDVEGLLDKDKKTVIRQVCKISPQVMSLACPTDKKNCVGGMVTKLEAARIAVESGIPCVITDGKKPNIILSTLKDPGTQGTLFLPGKRCLAARKSWIAFGARVKGKIIVDDGAKAALLNKKSLLPVGIAGHEGEFNAGDIVGVCDRQGLEFARGRVGISSRQLERIKGRRNEKEIIHCDDMVII